MNTRTKLIKGQVIGMFSGASITYVILDMCALPILIVLLLTTLVRRATKGVANKVFIALLIVVIIDTVFDVGALDVNYHYVAGKEYYYMMLHVTKMIFLSLRNSMSFLLMIFVYALTRTSYKLRTAKAKLWTGSPLYILIALIVTNPLHNLVFTVTPGTGYEHGPLSFLLYLVSTAYAIYGIIYLIRYKSFIAKEKFFTIIAIYALQIGATILQFFVKSLRCELFFATVGCLLMVLIVLRPEELIDASTGLLSRKAYANEIRKITFARQPVQIAVVRVNNAIQLRSLIGEERYNDYVMRLATQLERFVRENKLNAELYYDEPHNIYMIFDVRHADYNVSEQTSSALNIIRERMNTVREMGVETEIKILLLHYPTDVISTDDIMWLGRNFPRFMPYYSDYIDASEIIGTLSYEIQNNLDEILTNAIKNNLFEVYYQPIYSVKDKKFASAEALIRLKDEKYGMIPPGLFIPAAEASGAINSIGDFVLDSVFKFVSENKVEKLGLEFIEINLSIAQCMRKDFPDQIRALQQKYNVRPEQIDFEIVETINNSVGDTAEKNIREIAEMGYTFAIDDYGTGYSNIQRISSLPISIIKIDKSLVDIIGTHDGRSIIKNTVSMMKDINKKLVIEGVETLDVAKQLIAMDCDYIQGYYYSKPIPRGQFLMFISEKNSVNVTR